MNYPDLVPPVVLHLVPQWDATVVSICSSSIRVRRTRAANSWWYFIICFESVFRFISAARARYHELEPLSKNSTMPCSGSARLKMKQGVGHKIQGCHFLGGAHGHQKMFCGKCGSIRGPLPVVRVLVSSQVEINFAQHVPSEWSGFADPKLPRVLNRDSLMIHH